MKIVERMPLIIMIIMVILSFTNLFGLSIAGASVILGVVFFFINKAFGKQLSRDSGLDLKAIGTGLKDIKIWFWIALPLIMDIVSIGISRLFLPGYIEYEIARVGTFVSLDTIILSIFQLMVLALGEEIAWRAFFQNQLGRALQIIPAMLISSVLFAFGHWTEGNITIVAYNIFFVFINSFLYGTIFYKTNNAWISAISHFAANLFSIIVMVWL